MCHHYEPAREWETMLEAEEEPESDPELPDADMETDKPEEDIEPTVPTADD